MLTLDKAILLDEAFERLTKALRDEVRIRNANNKLLEENYRVMHPVIVKWMNYTNAQIIKALNKKYINKSFQKDEAGKIVTNLLDWDTLKQDNIRMVKPAALEIYEKGGNQSYKIAGIEGAFDVVNIEAVNKVNKICSELIVEVNKNTKKAINTLIKNGIEQGQSMGKIAKQIRPLVGLTERQSLAVVRYRERLTAKFPKYTDAKLNKIAKRYSDELHRHRADMIARTETARAQNEGTLQGYKRMGYKKVRWSANVNACSRCMALSGHTFTLEEASGMMPLHPDCRCCWVVLRERIKPKAPRIPRLESLKLSNANAKQLRGELKLNNMMFDKDSSLESMAMTKERIVKNLSKKLKNNKDFIKYIETQYKIPKGMTTSLDMNRAISDLIQNWAGTSGDENIRAIAMQIAVRKEFNLTKSVLNHFSKEDVLLAMKEFKTNGKAMQAFLRAQYNYTQEYLKEQGITHLTGYRGIRLVEKAPGFQFGDDIVTAAGKVQFQPMSSFSADAQQAAKFGYDPYNPYKMLLQSEVPINRILTTCQTGYGSKWEAEYVILGGQDMVKALTVRGELTSKWDTVQEYLKMFADFKGAPKVPIVPKLPKMKRK